MFRAVAVIALSTAFAFGSEASGQPLPGLPAEPVPAATPAEVPAELATPRATMQTFIEAMAEAARTGDKQQLVRAARCIDLSNLPAGVVEEVGVDLAVKLKDVMDHLGLVRLGSVPTAPKGDLWVWRELAALDARIALEKRADGRWLFDAATVGALDGLYDHFAGQPKVAGATSFSLALSPALWIRAQMPPALTGEWLLMEHWQWLFLLGLLFCGWLIGRVVRALLRGPVDRFLTRRSARVPSELIAKALAPLSVVLMGGVWHVGLRYVGLNAEVAAVILVVFKFLAAFGVVRIAMRSIHIVTHVLIDRARLTPSRFDDLAVPFFHKTAMVIVVALGILFMGDVLGVSPTSLLAGLGLGGLAVALAAQDTVKNLFGSFTVIFDRPFEVGDAIKLSADVQGTVEEVGFRSTRLRSADNTLITVPNGNLISANVENFGKRTFFRWKAALTLGAATPADSVEAFCRGAEELVRRHPETRQDGLTCLLDELGPAGLQVQLVCHFRVATWAAYATARHGLLLELLELARRLGVDFAFQLTPDAPGRRVPAASPALGPDAYAASVARALGEAAAIAGSTRQARATEPPAQTET
jgi:MscS family membrane protein